MAKASIRKPHAWPRKASPGLRILTSKILLLLSLSLLLGALRARAQTPADRVYRNGVLFTAVARNNSAEALAIRDGRIVYVGNNQGVRPFIGPTTANIDLQGGFLMPGLVDGHMHPPEAGMQLLKCVSITNRSPFPNCNNACRLASIALPNNRTPGLRW